MCFLHLNVLRVLVGIGAILSLLLSIGMLAAAIFINADRKDIIDNPNEPIIKDLIIAFYVISIVFLILSICGVYGSIRAKRKDKLAPCLLSTYSIGVLIFFLVFVILTIIFFAAPTAIFGENCTKGSKTHLIESLNNINLEAQQRFCTDECPCYLEPGNLQSELADWLRANGKKIGQDPNTSYVSYERCAKSTEDKETALFMSTLEQTLNCGGWCQSDPYPRFYKFFNINRCTSKECLALKPCYNSFKDFTISNGVKMGIAGVIATVFCLLNITFICCICCHPKRSKNSSKNFYARMLETQN